MKSAKEDKENSEVVISEENRRGINVINRQNSFRATRNFFANQGGGLIISPKEYKKNVEMGTSTEDDERLKQSRPLSKK